MSQLKPAQPNASSESPSPSMYESPSPPSTASSPELYPPGTAVIELPNADLPHSPIHPPTSWQRSFVPVVPDEATRLIPHSPRSDLALSRADLARAYAARQPGHDSRGRDRVILGCSVLAILTIVFIIIVSGITTLLANRNFPVLEVTSDWPNGGIIPLKYGCHAPGGKPISIPLHWRNIPRAATNLVILFANPGNIKKSGLDPVHWFLTDIPLNEGGLDSFPANASANPSLLPHRTKQRPNAFSKHGEYWPPCVRNGTSFFAVHIYAIDASPHIDTFKDAREVMNRFVGVPVARITGVYGKPSKLVIPSKGNGVNGSSNAADYQHSETADADRYDNDNGGVGQFHAARRELSQHKPMPSRQRRQQQEPSPNTTAESDESSARGDTPEHDASHHSHSGHGHLK